MQKNIFLIKKIFLNTIQYHYTITNHCEIEAFDWQFRLFAGNI